MADLDIRLKNDTDEDRSWHNPYDQELREQESIRSGDVEGLKRCWAETYEGSIGRLANDPVRHMKNLAIGVISISSRSAIAGGLNPETVFSIVDDMILKIEHGYTKEDQILGAIHNTQMRFTEMVHENRNNRIFNPLVSRAKDYIAKNIYDKIVVGEIADWLGVNADYLSSLFSSSEHKTISQFIMEEKIKLCCNMLKFSDYSIQRISAYFGFCSQSHFTKHFKNCIGMTPGQYRKLLGKVK